MPFLLPNQQCQSTEWQTILHFCYYIDTTSTTAISFMSAGMLRLAPELNLQQTEFHYISTTARHFHIFPQLCKVPDICTTAFLLQDISWFSTTCRHTTARGISCCSSDVTNFDSHCSVSADFLHSVRNNATDWLVTVGWYGCHLPQRLLLLLSQPRSISKNTDIMSTCTNQLSTLVKSDKSTPISFTSCLTGLTYNLHKAWVKVLRPTQHKIGNFGDVLPSQSLGIVLKKLNLTRQKQTNTYKL